MSPADASPGRTTSRGFLAALGQHAGDLALPGALEVAFARSAHAHALMGSLDLEGSAAAAGIVAIYRARDLPADLALLKEEEPRLAGFPAARRPALAESVVKYVGEPFAVIVGRSRPESLRVAEGLSFLPEAQPVMLSLEDLTPSSPGPSDAQTRSPLRWTRGAGDLDAAWSRAQRVLRVPLRLERVSPAPLELLAIVARYSRREGKLHVWLGSQAPERAQAQLCAALGLRSGDLELHPREVGGSFGSRRSLCPEELVVAWLALRHAPLPIRYVASRRELMISAPQARGLCGEAVVAVTGQGKLLGLQLRASLDLGAYPERDGCAAVSRLLASLPGAYGFEAWRAELTGVLTNKPPAGFYRGSGLEEATYVIERALETVAIQLELDPIELRRVNLAAPGPASGMPSQGDGKSALAGALEALATRTQYGRLRTAQEDMRKGTLRMGVGIALAVDAPPPETSIAGWSRRWEAARVSITPDCEAEVRVGAVSCGRGLEAALSRIAAEELRLPLDSVRTRLGERGAAPVGSGATASQSMARVGGAVAQAAQRLRWRLRALASDLLRAPPEYVLESLGGFTAGERSITREELCRHAYRAGGHAEGCPPGLDEIAYVEVERAPVAWTAHLAVVTVDRETGQIAVPRYTALTDCGRAIFPDGVDAQVLGGIAQGIGRALRERLVHDREGRPQVTSLSAYDLLGAANLPEVDMVRIESRAIETGLGARSVGEVCAAAALPAVVNGVLDALRTRAALELQPPLGAEAVWKAASTREPT